MYVIIVSDTCLYLISSLRVFLSLLIPDDFNKDPLALLRMTFSRSFGTGMIWLIKTI